MPADRSRKKRKDDFPEEDEDERVLFFVPSTGIKIEVLVHYLRQFLGDDSDADPGAHPQDPSKVGYYVRSRLGLSAVMIRDLKDDSADWTEEIRRTRIKERYGKSMTAQRRAEKGPSGQPSVPAATAARLAARGEKIETRQGSTAPTAQQISAYQQPATAGDNSEMSRHDVQGRRETQTITAAAQQYDENTASRHEQSLPQQPPNYLVQYAQTETTTQYSEKRANTPGYAVSNVQYSVPHQPGYSSPQAQPATLQRPSAGRHPSAFSPQATSYADSQARPWRPPATQPDPDGTFDENKRYATAGPKQERHNRQY